MLWNVCAPANTKECETELSGSLYFQEIINTDEPSDEEELSIFKSLYDILFIKGQKYWIKEEPLLQHNDYKNLAELALYSFDSRKIYKATWRLEKDSLFLELIINLGYPVSEAEIKLDLFSDNDFTDLSVIFPVECKKGIKIFAAWVSGELTTIEGKLLFDETLSEYDIDPDPVFEKETGLIFKKGILQKTTVYDNSKSIQEYNSYLRIEQIYTALDWSKVPDLGDQKKKCIVLFSANAQRIIDSVKVQESAGSLYDHLAIAAIKTVSNAQIKYIKGKHTRVWEAAEIIFSEQKRNLYTHLSKDTLVKQYQLYLDNHDQFEGRITNLLIGSSSLSAIPDWETAYRYSDIFGNPLIDFNLNLEKDFLAYEVSDQQSREMYTKTKDPKYLLKFLRLCFHEYNSMITSPTIKVIVPSYEYLVRTEFKTTFTPEDMKSFDGKILYYSHQACKIPYKIEKYKNGAEYTRKTYDPYKTYHITY